MTENGRCVIHARLEARYILGSDGVKQFVSTPELPTGEAIDSGVPMSSI
jgi:hypothetical protein